MTGSSGQRRGFTLLELLVAMALLATLGTFLVSLLKNSFDLYRQGDQRGDLYANAVPILEKLEDDLRAVHSGPDGRFLLETSSFGGGKGMGDGFLLRLVRVMPHGEQSHPVLRKAGSKPGAQGRFDGSDPGPEARADLAPPSGLMEVAWALITEPADAADRPGILTLYRGVHAPALQKGSFFDTGAEGGPDEAWVRTNLRPVATDVLGLWILCYGQESQDWGEADVLERTNPEGLSSSTWDSTRGILPRAAFALARSPESAADPRDDVYPRMVRLILHVGRGSRPEAKLRTTMRPDDTILRVNSTRDLPVEGVDDRMVKVGLEWMALGTTEATDARVQRRRRHTSSVQVAHPVGTPVYSGQVFRKTLDMPARRSFWVEPGR